MSSNAATKVVPVGKLYEVTYPNGDMYVGGMQGTSRSGAGNFLSRESGDLFSGQWLCDKREGPGVLKFAKIGRILRGYWVNDVCVTGELFDADLPALQLADAPSVVAATSNMAEAERRILRAKYMPVEDVLPRTLLEKAVKLIDANKTALSKGGPGRRKAIQAVMDALELAEDVTEEEAENEVLRVLAVAYTKGRRSLTRHQRSGRSAYRHPRNLLEAENRTELCTGRYLATLHRARDIVGLGSVDLSQRDPPESLLRESSKERICHMRLAGRLACIILSIVEQDRRSLVN